MTDPRHDLRNESPTPLEYRAPREDRPPRGQVVGPFIGGMVIAFVCIPIIGLLWLNDLRLSAKAEPHDWVIRTPVVVFGLVGIAAGFGCVAVWRARGRHYFALGILVGLTVACLIEGLCYASG